MEIFVTTGDERSLDRVIETLVARFPRIDADAVTQCVYATYASLKRDATIESHLTALTRRRATETLTQMTGAASPS